MSSWGGGGGGRPAPQPKRGLGTAGSLTSSTASLISPRYDPNSCHNNTTATSGAARTAKHGIAVPPQVLAAPSDVHALRTAGASIAGTTHVHLRHISAELHHADTTQPHNGITPTTTLLG